MQEQQEQKQDEFDDVTESITMKVMTLEDESSEKIGHNNNTSSSSSLSSTSFVDGDSMESSSSARLLQNKTTTIQKSPPPSSSSSSSSSSLLEVRKAAAGSRTSNQDDQTIIEKKLIMSEKIRKMLSLANTANNNRSPMISAQAAFPLSFSNDYNIVGGTGTSTTTTTFEFITNNASPTTTPAAHTKLYELIHSIDDNIQKLFVVIKMQMRPTNTTTTEEEVTISTKNDLAITTQQQHHNIICQKTTKMILADLTLLKAHCFDMDAERILNSLEEEEERSSSLSLSLSLSWEEEQNAGVLERRRRRRQRLSECPYFETCLNCAIQILQSSSLSLLPVDDTKRSSLPVSKDDNNDASIIIDNNQSMLHNMRDLMNNLQHSWNQLVSHLQQKTVSPSQSQSQSQS